MKVSKHFTRDELACRCGCGLFNMAPPFIYFLEKTRAKYGGPMVITSGCRCYDHNKKVGGADDSSHKEGLAVDVRVADGADARALVEAAMSQYVEGVGVYDTWIHLDMKERAKPVIW